jgi:hypothetical protein
MSNVIAFPKKVGVHPPSMTTPLPEHRWADVFFDAGQWRLSKKGNRYVRLDACCITLFHRPGGWAWCVAGPAWFKPLWSAGTFVSEREARVDVWEWLIQIERRERFMNPANWETVEKNGYRRCIEIGPHGVILHRLRNGRWCWDLYQHRNSLLEGDIRSDGAVYDTEEAARIEAWKALEKLI